MIYIPLIFLLALTTQQSHAKLVTDHYGGDVFPIAKDVVQLLRNDEMVEFKGVCYSACTLYLKVPDICYHDRTQFGFHLPRAFGRYTSGKILIKDYPDWVNDWIDSKGGLGPDMMYMDQNTMKTHIKKC